MGVCVCACMCVCVCVCVMEKGRKNAKIVCVCVCVCECEQLKIQHTCALAKKQHSHTHTTHTHTHTHTHSFTHHQPRRPQDQAVSVPQPVGHALEPRLVHINTHIVRTTHHPKHVVILGLGKGLDCGFAFVDEAVVYEGEEAECGSDDKQKQQAGGEEYCFQRVWGAD